MADREPTSADAQLVLAMTLGVAQTQVLAAAAQLRLGDLLADGPRGLAELADATGANADALGRLLGAMQRLGLVEPAEGRYRLTTAGELLRADSPYSVRHYAELMGSAWLGQTWPHLADAVRTGASQFPKVHGATLYGYNQRHAHAANTMQLAMSEISGQESRVLLDAVDLSGVGHVVDVGGGRGALLAALLRAHPGLHGTVLDLPAVAEAARATLSAPDLVGRASVLGGSFFEPLPAGGEVYLLKRVLMDCSDDEALRLFAGVRAVLPRTGRLVIADPDPTTAYGAMMDMLMLIVFGSRLRSDAEIAALLAKSGLTLRSSRATDCALRLHEAVAA
jgi:O-methyltransferase